MSLESQAPSRAPSDPTERLFSCKRLPIRYLVIPKCGCTFVKNLIWTIDNSENYHFPARIHERDADFARPSNFGVTASDIRREEYSFVVLRNPVDRFLSLYFDKVAGEGHKRFVPLRKVLIDKRNLESSPTLAREHLRNCNILIDWIEENLASKIDLQPDPHWTPQKYRFGIIRDLNLKVLTLNGLESKLALLISDIVPHARSLMSGIERYSSNSSFKTNEVLDKQIKAKINSVYERDRDVFEHVRDLWRDLSPGSGLEIPRASDLFQN